MGAGERMWLGIYHVEAKTPEHFSRELITPSHQGVLPGHSSPLTLPAHHVLGRLR